VEELPQAFGFYVAKADHHSFHQNFLDFSTVFFAIDSSRGEFSHLADILPFKPLWYDSLKIIHFGSQTINLTHYFGKPCIHQL
jgi:hypothetical protein